MKSGEIYIRKKGDQDRPIKLKLIRPDGDIPDHWYCHGDTGMKGLYSGEFIWSRFDLYYRPKE